MGQWVSCAALSAEPAATASANLSAHTYKSPAANAINRRAAGTESTVVHKSAHHSTTTCPFSTTTQLHYSCHPSASPPPHRRYLPPTTSVPFVPSAPASSPPALPAHVRSSSGSSCSSSVCLSSAASDVCPPTAMVRTSSHVDDIIEEVVEPVPSPCLFPSVRPPPRSVDRAWHDQPVEDADDARGDVRCVTLKPLVAADQLLSPRSVLAFLIVSNGGDCRMAAEDDDDDDWEDDVEEMDDDDAYADDEEDEEEDDEDTTDGMSMSDILASLPKTSTIYHAPYSATLPSYSSLPSLPSASSLRPTTRPHTSNSLSYPSLTSLAARNLPTRSPNKRPQQPAAPRQAAVDETPAGLGRSDDGMMAVWCDGVRVMVSTRSVRVAQPQWTNAVCAL